MFLDNVHLMSKWLPKLNRMLEVCAENAHENFRAFLSAEPHPDPQKKYIPQNILESSIKVVNMPPTTLKANVRRAYAQFSQATLEGCAKKREIRAMIFGLSFFHACMVSRHKFGSQGWSRSYGFNFGDLTISGNVISNYLNANDFVPWKDVRYLIAEVMYGGHITDHWDRRVDIAYLEEIMKPEMFSGFDLTVGFKMPPCDEDFQFYSKYIEEKFPTETPPLFKLHNNAEIGFLLESSRALFVILSDLGGIVLSDEEGGSGAGSALSMVDAFLEQTPVQFDADDLATRAEAHLTNPFVCVLLQEVQRMNLLLGTLVGSLQELKLGLDGALNMSDSMESLLETLPLDRVPATWAAYPSLKSLGAWFADLLTRIEVLTPWAETLETPVVVWISGLFNPMAFITAVLQATARGSGLPLDQMEVWTDIPGSSDLESFSEPPEDGAYIHGLCMEGARWEVKKNCITDSHSKDLYPVMPVMQVRGIVTDEVDKNGIFDCPIYITTQRGPTFTFVATLRTQDPVNKWVLAGVALIMQWDVL